MYEYLCVIRKLLLHFSINFDKVCFSGIWMKLRRLNCKKTGKIRIPGKIPTEYFHCPQIERDPLWGCHFLYLYLFSSSFKGCSNAVSSSKREQNDLFAGYDIIFEVLTAIFLLFNFYLTGLRTCSQMNFALVSQDSTIHFPPVSTESWTHLWNIKNILSNTPRLWKFRNNLAEQSCSIIRYFYHRWYTYLIQF